MRPRLEDLRIKMLEKCFDCFCKNGLENTSTKKLAEACGMTDGNIFHYFASKDEIIIKSTAHCMGASTQRHGGHQAVFRRDPVLDGEKTRQEIPLYVTGLRQPEISGIRQRIFCGRYKALHRIRKEFRADARHPVADLAAADLYVCTRVRALRAVRGRGLSETADCADRRNAAFDHGKVRGKISC